jgi:MFS family permease
MRTWAGSTFSSLGDPHYRILWAGTTTSFLAFAMSMIVQGVVAFEITGKNGAVGLVGLGMGVATILTAPFGGVVADRFSKRLLLLTGQVLIFANFAAVGILVLGDWITIGLLAASTFVQGLVFSFIAPARQAWIGDMLTGERLSNGIALQQIGMTATRIVGPWLAVALVGFGFIGAGGTYLFMAGLIFVCLLTLLQLPRPRATAPRKASALGDLKLGYEHVASRPRLALLAVSFMLVVMFGFSYQVILPGYLNNVLGHSTKDMGWLLGVSGVAGLIATIAVANKAGTRLAWPLLIAGGLAQAAGLVGLGAVDSFAFALLLMLAIGAGSSVFQMLNSALIMQESDPAFYGRVMALTMLAWGMNSIAGVPFGNLADGIGEQSTLVVMGILVALVTGATGLAANLLRRPVAPAVSAVAVGDSAAT